MEDINIPDNMLTEKEIKALLANHENERVELTVSTTNTDKFAQAVCAFANDKGLQQYKTSNKGKTYIA